MANIHIAVGIIESRPKRIIIKLQHEVANLVDIVYFHGFFAYGAIRSYIYITWEDSDYTFSPPAYQQALSFAPLLWDGMSFSALESHSMGYSHWAFMTGNAPGNPNDFEGNRIYGSFSSYLGLSVRMDGTFDATTPIGTKLFCTITHEFQ